MPVVGHNAGVEGKRIIAILHVLDEGRVGGVACGQIQRFHAVVWINVAVDVVETVCLPIRHRWVCMRADACRCSPERVLVPVLKAQQAYLSMLNIVKYGDGPFVLESIAARDTPLFVDVMGA